MLLREELPYTYERNSFSILRRIVLSFWALTNSDNDILLLVFWK